MSWCTPHLMASFSSRLPVVRDRASPWYGYLKAVYGGEIDLPFDMSGLGLVALPTGRASLKRVPFDTKCQPNRHAETRFACVASSCDWLLPTEPERAARPKPRAVPDWLRIMARRTNATYPWPWRHPCSHGPEGCAARTAEGVKRESIGNVRLLALEDGTISRTWYLQGGNLALYRVPAEEDRVAFPDHSWVEVMREPDDREGQGYGCWFYPLMPPFARGSGVHMNLGRSLVFRTRREAMQALRRPGTIDDAKWASEARRQGYDSVQVLPGPFGPPPM